MGVPIRPFCNLRLNAVCHTLVRLHVNVGAWMDILRHINDVTPACDGLPAAAAAFAMKAIDNGNNA
jgi:hypothetical protein